MNLITKSFIFLTLYTFSVFSFSIVNAQNLTQVLKGNIVDIETQTTLPGATVVILGTNPMLGVASDMDGNYRINSVPLGRYNIQIDFIGYEPVVIPEMLFTSSKEVVLNVGLKQSITSIEEVVVKAHSRKDRPVNSMASISAKSFTVEETRRYAGGMDDPARMASAFAGVTVGSMQDNAIIIRGNSPKGVSWRLEGVEIPNPNHFAGGNVAGGGFITIFSSQLLTNSDFFTGAFPAEYGNALAGVFDMKLRSGNNEKRESTIQLGVLGIDFASEGPFVKGGKSSYLFNYRYSTFGLLSKMGILPSAQVPRFQDLSFKLNFPTKKAGAFSVWGIGAIDFNQEPVKRDSSKWTTNWDRNSYDWDLDMGAAGATHKIILGKQTYLNTSISASGTVFKIDMKRFDDSLTLRPNQSLADKSGRVGLNTFINHKFTARHTIRTGLNYSKILYNIDLSSTINEDPETFQNFVKQNGSSD
ncbi:MAG: carboxypeptidase-like regulatory domain-containing protein [Tenuifilaceae bacterium]|nr:carboxypeptidase-like regulatory domain-containing protein [Tenuifilaceae bacterium]